MFCSRCGYENRLGANFCARCGNSLSPPSSVQSNTNTQQMQPQQQVLQNKAVPSQVQSPLTMVPISTRHWTVTLAFVVWVLATLSNLYTTVLGFGLRYNPQIGVGLILTLLSFFTAYNMYDADKEGLYTGIIAIVIAFVWDAMMFNYFSIAIVVIIAVITFVSSSHLVKGGIKKPVAQ